MQWQMFTAFGIFLGTLMGRVFYDVGNVDSNEVCTEALKNKVFATLLSTECVWAHALHLATVLH